MVFNLYFGKNEICNGLKEINIRLYRLLKMIKLIGKICKNVALNHIGLQYL